MSHGLPLAARMPDTFHGWSRSAPPRMLRCNVIESERTLLRRTIVTRDAAVHSKPAYYVGARSAFPVLPGGDVRTSREFLRATPDQTRRECRRGTDFRSQTRRRRSAVSPAA